MTKKTALPEATKGSVIVPTLCETDEPDTRNPKTCSFSVAEAKQRDHLAVTSSHGTRVPPRRLWFTRKKALTQTISVLQPNTLTSSVLGGRLASGRTAGYNCTMSGVAALRRAVVLMMATRPSLSMPLSGAFDDKAVVKNEWELAKTTREHSLFRFSRTIIYHLSTTMITSSVCTVLANDFRTTTLSKRDRHADRRRRYGRRRRRISDRTTSVARPFRRKTREKNYYTDS